MDTTARRLAASMLMSATLQGQAATTAPTPAPPQPAGSLMDAARRDAARFARELPPEDKPDAGKVLRSDRQAQLERGFDAAYAAAHRPLAEVVTTAADGTDIVTRILTPFGANLCMNWREKNRFVPTKGKTLFMGACNR